MSSDSTQTQMESNAFCVKIVICSFPRKRTLLFSRKRNGQFSVTYLGKHLGSFDTISHSDCLRSGYHDNASNRYLLGDTKLGITRAWGRKRPIRTRYLGHVTGYQPIRQQYFQIWLVPNPGACQPQGHQAGPISHHGVIF